MWMPHHYRKSLIILLLTWLISACSSVPTQEEPDTGKLHFELSGRIGIKYEAQSDQAQVFWRHGDKGDWVRLEGPLGQTVATIANIDQQTTLVTADKTWQASNPESLTEEVLGWPLPLAGMSNWMLGRPDLISRSGPAVSQTVNEIPQIEQSGWKIRYLANDDTNHLPKKVELTRGDLQIKVVIDEWNKGPGFTEQP